MGQRGGGVGLRTQQDTHVNSKLVITSRLSIPMSEIEFRTSRSSGPGGQNVNKLETRVELLYDVERSSSLTDEQRDLLFSRLKSNIDKEGVLRVVSQESRSQWKNKQEAIEKFVQLLRDALKPRKIRRKTTATPHSREKRLMEKKCVSEKKRMRRSPHD
jgi:ribosome-associated protein